MLQSIPRAERAAAAFQQSEIKQTLCAGSATTHERSNFSNSNSSVFLYRVSLYLPHSRGVKALTRTKGDAETERVTLRITAGPRQSGRLKAFNSSTDCAAAIHFVNASLSPSSPTTIFPLSSNIDISLFHPSFRLDESLLAFQHIALLSWARTLRCSSSQSVSSIHRIYGHRSSEHLSKLAIVYQLCHSSFSTSALASATIPSGAGILSSYYTLVSAYKLTSITYTLRAAFRCLELIEHRGSASHHDTTSIYSDQSVLQHTG